MAKEVGESCFAGAAAATDPGGGATTVEGPWSATVPQVVEGPVSTAIEAAAEGPVSAAARAGGLPDAESGGCGRNHKARSMMCCVCGSCRRR